MIRLPSLRSRWIAFLVVLGAALSFALYTRHAWEDYWITFRASRNLAEGHGLVFNPGDRLHTFTSPLGVLLPALAYGMTGNSSDYAALWIFRAMSAAALGGAAWLLFSGARRAGYSPLVAAALVGLIACDAKTLDFTTNGMETGFVLLFLAWFFHALLTRPARPWLHLGVAWAGLMWSRPDSFIYVGAIAVAVLLCNDPARSGRTRVEWLKIFLGAGLVTVVLYAPWLIGTTLYYGTPVPHTVIAKSLERPPVSWGRFLMFLQEFPLKTWGAGNSMAATFLPPYFDLGGWPGWAAKISAIAAIVCASSWLLPFIRWEGRVASFAFFIAHLYLGFLASFHFPWYLPTPAMLGLIVIAALAQTVRDALARIHSASVALGLLATLTGGLVASLLFSAHFAWDCARQMAAAQRWIEDGNRKQIGLYLREHAKAQDSVLLEPLGYIGYFSQLKTFDYPGLSSSEMVAARKKVGSNWAALINFLQPTWLVLRDYQLDSLVNSDAGIVHYRYTLEKVFDVSEEVKKLNIPGRKYLEFDQRFSLYRRVEPRWNATAYGDVRGEFPGNSETKVGDVTMLVVHAPGEIVVPIPPGATEVTVQFGFPVAAYTSPTEKTDGARFSLHWSSGKADYEIWSRRLRPDSEAADRGPQTVTQKLPNEAGGTHLILRTVSEYNYTRDWTAWTRPVFK